MPARTAIYANGVDLCDTYGMVITSAPGLWDSFVLQDQSVAIPRRMGELQTSADPVVPAREFTLAYAMRASSVAARIANEDAIAQLLYGSLVEIVRVDLATRARYGRVQRYTMMPTGAAFVSPEAKGEIVVRCLDPLAYELALTTIAFGSTRTALPSGTTPFSPRTLIANATAGSLVNFTLTQRSPAGDVVATMGLTGTLLTGEYLDIDHALMSIAKVDASGTRTSARSWLTSGTYFVFRPGDTIEVDKGSGSALYWKSYF